RHGDRTAGRDMAARAAPDREARIGDRIGARAALEDYVLRADERALRYVPSGDDVLAGLFAIFSLRDVHAEEVVFGVVVAERGGALPHRARKAEKIVGTQRRLVILEPEKRRER